MVNLQEIFDYVKAASVEDLRHILNSVQNELPKREGKVDNFVSHIEDFCDDDVLLDAVWAECESLQMNAGEGKNKAQTAWLCSQDKPYIYTDTNPVHSPQDISGFPNIKRLLSLVNSSTEITGPLDSCLVIKYKNNLTSTSLHCDNETLMDQEKSICSFSLGCERTLEFYEGTKKNPKCAKKIRMKNNSLVIMRPGTQQNLRHAVRAERAKKGDGPEKLNQIRYSLSFRAIVKNGSPAGSETSGTRVTSTPAGGNKVQEPRQKVTLVAGDSYAQRLDSAKLGKGKVTVVNVAEGGAKMDKVQKQLEDYSAAHPNVQVDKLLISVGTNDIRRVEDVGTIRGPLKQLCSKICLLFPNCKVYVQSLLPLPLKDDNDRLTNKRIIEFNRILFNECVFRRFFFMDVFYPFTKFKRSFNEPIRRFDPLFESNGIHPNPQKGMGVLARFYIRAIHSRYFNPYVYQ
jgi:alkylated DNA repair dioxygenase AlkB/lysophospholipase L1-like esterase